MLPVDQGLHWVRGREGGTRSFAEDVPGTHAVMRPNRMEAWRCRRCKLIVFRYGESLDTRRERYATEPPAQTL